VNEHQQPAQPQRKVGILLGVGIFFLPYVFSWFTLRSGYSNLARGLSLGWLAILVISIATRDNNAAQSHHASAPLTPAAPQAAEPKVPEACSYFGREFIMGEWHDVGFDDEVGSWQCISRYVEIGAGVPLPNNIAYYVAGREDGPRRLKLSLSVNSPKDKTSAIDTLGQRAATLVQKALSAELPPDIRDAILEARDASTTLAGSRVYVERENFAASGIKGGFNLRFAIDVR
jgi:hypothetical protein